MPSKMAGNKVSTTPPPDACSSTTRLQRNLAEKQRRDKLNGFISELATIVPMVSMASKRLDKTSILRLSAAHLRIYQSSLSGHCRRSRGSFRWRPSFLNNEQIKEILESVDGFLLVTTTSGKIMYISQTVERFLGHQDIEMIGHSIFSFVHPADADMVRAQLQTLCLAVTHKNGGSSNSARCSFYCRLRERNQPRSEVLTYQFVHVVGHMTDAVSDDSSSDDDERVPRTSQTNLLLKAFVRVVHSNPYNELSLSEAIEDEYVTRHSLDGTIIFADHRLSTITGHLPHEVYGMSAYEYIIKDDIPIALFAHKLMFSHNSGTGLIVYRLRMRNQGFVYLKSTGYLQFERSSTQVDHFVCVNRLLSDNDGDQELKKFSERFTPHISGSSTSSLYESIREVQVKGLPAPSSTEVKNEAKNGNTSDTDSSAVVTKEVECAVFIKVEPHEELLSEQQQKLHASSTNSLSSSEHSHLQVILGSYSQRVYEKMSLESDSAGQFANQSPLTESSLSANSPQSEDTCMLSPNEGGRESIDSVAYSHDTCSSADLPDSPLSPQELQGQKTISQEQKELITLTHCSTPFLMQITSEGAETPRHAICTIQQNNERSPSLPISPPVIDVDSTSASYTSWEGSPFSSGGPVLGCHSKSHIPSPSLPLEGMEDQGYRSPSSQSDNSQMTDC